MDFEGTYRLVEKTLSPLRITVGRCDSAANSALAARFQIYQIPSIFVIRGSSVWWFDGTLSHDKIVEFVKTGYRNKPAMPFWESPMGPLGMFKGFLIDFGMQLFNLPGTIRAYLGISVALSLILVGLIVGGTAVSVASLFVYMTLPREKVD
jgi:hypothetical protein